MSADAATGRNPADLLRTNARLYPDKIAIVSPLGQLTYRDFEARSDEYAQILHAAGLRQGTKTVLMVKPSIDLYVMAFALLKIGAVPIVVDPGMGIKRLLYSYKSVAAEAFVGIPVAHAIRILTPQFFPNLKVKAWIRKGRLTTRGSPPPAAGVFPIAKIRERDLAIITFTTGSTGPAKPVEAHFGMLSGIVTIIQTAFSIRPADVDLVTVPFFGVVSLCIGATVVIPAMDPGKPADVNPETIIDTIQRYKVSTMFASPALLDKVGAFARRRDIVFPSLQCVNSGGAPITLEIMTAFRQTMRADAKFYTGWGATEGLPLAAIEADEILKDLKPQILNGRGAPIGFAMPGLAIRIIRITDDPIPRWDDNILAPDGSIGEIVVQGPNVSRAYHQNPQADLIHKIHGPGPDEIWHRTGDLGWFDKQGRLFFSGRKAHSFQNEQGDLLHSVACEGVANAHPQVKRSALVPVGREPVICLELKEPPSREEKERIAQEVLESLAACSVTRSIRTILFHRRFPVDLRHNAKIERPKLAQWAAQMLAPSSKLKHAAKIVPIAGWIFIGFGFFVPLSPAWKIIWWIDIFLSTVVHLAQIPKGTEAGQIHGFTPKEAAWRTLLLGATWWKPLLPK